MREMMKAVAEGTETATIDGEEVPLLRAAQDLAVGALASMTGERLNRALAVAAAVAEYAAIER